MPQHLWVTASIIRVCEVCNARQFGRGNNWTPPVNSICPGDDDDAGSSSRRRRPRPLAPSTTHREMELA